MEDFVMTYPCYVLIRRNDKKLEIFEVGGDVLIAIFTDDDSLQSFIDRSTAGKYFGIQVFSRKMAEGDLGRMIADLPDETEPTHFIIDPWSESNIVSRLKVKINPLYWPWR